MKEQIITPSNAQQRIDKFILKLMPNMGKSLMYKMFRKKNITLNGGKISGSELLRDQDVIHIFFSDETYAKFTNPITEVEEVSLPTVIFENDDLLVVNKTTDVFAQPDPQGTSITDQIAYYYQCNGLQLADGVKIGVSNRLDRNTTGIVVSGKNLPMIHRLNEAILHKTVIKRYRTIVKGVVTEPMTLKGYLTKDFTLNQVSVGEEGDYYIETSLQPISTNGRCSYVEVGLITGKTHQIRAHLASIGHPIVGDTKYGDAKVNQIMKLSYQLNHQLLHCYSYAFNFHDHHEPMTFTAPIPGLFQSILEGESLNE